MQLTSLSILALFIACLFAACTSYLLSDFTFDIFFIRETAMDPHTLGWVAVLGVFCGLYSIYYNYSKIHATTLFSSIRNPWIGAVATGLSLSLGAFLFPALFGEGFDLITELVNGESVSFTASGLFAGHHGRLWLYAAIACILLLKGVLVAASYSNGGVAGDFVPTFFAGALAGYLFALLCNDLLGAHLPPWYFALIGMGAVMAGTIHAPLMAIFLCIETTNTFGYLFPYLIAVAVSYATVKIITPRSWYAEAGHDDLMALLQRRDTPSLKVRIEEPAPKRKEATTRPAVKNEDSRK